MNRRNFIKKMTRGCLAGWAGLVGLKSAGAPARQLQREVAERSAPKKITGQVWNTNALGGYMYSKNLSKQLQKSVHPMLKFRQFCRIK